MLLFPKQSLMKISDLWSKEIYSMEMFLGWRLAPIQFPFNYFTSILNLFHIYSTFNLHLFHIYLIYITAGAASDTNLFHLFNSFEFGAYFGWLGLNLEASRHFKF